MRLSADNLFTLALLAVLLLALTLLPGQPTAADLPATELHVEGLDAGGSSRDRTFTFWGSFVTGRGQPGRFPARAFLVLNKGTLEAAGHEFELQPSYDTAQGEWTFRSKNTLRAGQNDFWVEARDGARVLERSKGVTVEGRFAAPAFRVQMVWDRPLADIDLHALGPGGSHAFFGNDTPLGTSDFSLDYDYTGSAPGESGFGPENITVTGSAPGGRYAFEVQYFQPHGESGPVTATVYLFNSRDERVATFRHTFGPGESAPGSRIRGSGQSPWIGRDDTGVWLVPFDPAAVTKG